MAIVKRRIAAISPRSNFRKISAVNEKRPQMRSFLHIKQEFKQF
jgi:hypothetical protein